MSQWSSVLPLERPQWNGVQQALSMHTADSPAVHSGPHSTCPDCVSLFDLYDKLSEAQDDGIAGSAGELRQCGFRVPRSVPDKSIVHRRRQIFPSSGSDDHVPAVAAVELIKSVLVRGGIDAACIERIEVAFNFPRLRDHKKWVEAHMTSTVATTAATPDGSSLGSLRLAVLSLHSARQPETMTTEQQRCEESAPGKGFLEDLQCLPSSALTFHGVSSLAAAEAILVEGFDLERCGTAFGDWYGCGIYSTTFPAYATRYAQCDRTAAAGGCRGVLICFCGLGGVVNLDDISVSNVPSTSSSVNTHYALTSWPRSAGGPVVTKRNPEKATGDEICVFQTEQLYPAFLVRLRVD